MPSRVPLREYSAHRIALIKPSSLGDIVHALPVLTALRRRFPEAHLAWVVNRGYAPLLEGHPDLDTIVPFDRGTSNTNLVRAVLSYSRFARQFRRRNFDLVIDLQGLLRSGLLTAASGAPRRVGLSSAREGATWFYTDTVQGPSLRRSHAVDRCWSVAEALGAGHEPKCFLVPLQPAQRDWARNLLRGFPRPWLMLGVGSRWQTKRWPAGHFAALVSRALDRFGGTPVFVGGRDEVPLARAAAERLPPGGSDLTGRTTLPQLAAVLNLADVMIANDTGPLHLAAALGRPVIAPYTCTSPGETGPYGAATGAIVSRIWCQGSRLKHCRRMECMAELTPDRLWPALEQVLLQWESRSLSA
jgi:lipopolysaccharide heptosyltransferase I